jgi:hypothetical protein
MLVAYPSVGDDRSQALLRQAKDRKALVSIARLPLLPGITYIAAAGQVKAASIAWMQRSFIPGRDEAD